MRPPLSLPIGRLQPHYDIVVVGSGYGGSVAAYRLAQRAKRDAEKAGTPPISIALLERGREWMTGEFPSTAFSAFRQLQYETPEGRRGPETGLFDLRNDDRMMVLVGCGLGGTSLINANVMLRPTAAVFATGWPTLDRPWLDELGGHYDEVVRLIGASPLSTATLVRKRDNLYTLDPKTHLSPDLAVSFATGPNPFDVPQRRCEMCGDCITGCNHGAKRTLDFTYLAGARAAGVEIFCNIEVHSVASHPPPDSSHAHADPGHYPWLVHARPIDRGWRAFGAPTMAIRAKQVFLAAGTLGTTEILLRSRVKDDKAGNPNGGTRLRLSGMLGEKYSGNGDVIAFSYNGREKVEAFGYGVNVPEHPVVGPCITSMLDEREQASGLSIQDAAVPGALASVIRFIGPWIARQTPTSWAGAGSGGVMSELDTFSRGTQHGAVAKTQVFLVQARDKADGTLSLSPRGRLRINWLHPESDTFLNIHRRLADLSRKLGGRFAASPFWIRRPGEKLITVHPLGGVAMANSARDGVVNHLGQVFASPGEGVHKGLYACDGAIVPTALGANPALTIAALADRIAENVVLPLSAATDEPKPRSVPHQIPGQLGVRYAERLTGWCRDSAGRETSLTLTLHLSAQDVSRVIQDRMHEVSIVGAAETRTWTQKRWTITNGTLNVLVEDPRRPDTRLMVYRLWLEAADGTRRFLRGHKTINLETCRRSTWKAISSFPLIVRTPEEVANQPFLEASPFDGRPESEPSSSADRSGDFARACDACDDADIDGRGVGFVANSMQDALRLAGSISITNAKTLRDAWWPALRFGGFFAREVLAARFWFLRQTVRQDPFRRPHLDVPEENRTVFDDPRRPGPGFRLSRFLPPRTSDADMATLPQVVLGPGFGMSADAFLSGAPSLAEYLLNKGYVVWLLDYRASDHLAASLSQFTLDDLVEDFKNAYEMVYEKAGNRPVHVIGHCVASLVTSMYLLKHPTHANAHLRSVVLSQSFAFMDHPLVNRIKAGIYLPEVMKQLRFDSVLTVDDDLRADWRARLFDKLLHLYPTREHCSSGVCRRTIYLYGEVLRHENIDRHTHGMIYDLFDRANLTSFVHIAKMIRVGHIVDRHGRNTYLSHEKSQQIAIPVTFLQGAKNRLFRPPGGRQTLTWFQTRDDGQGTSNKDLFKLVTAENYAHLDHFIGKRADKDVFPTLLQALSDNTLLRDQDGITIGPSIK